jgi:HSP20 family protein
MDIKKLAPWNWFKDEETSEGRIVPVARPTQQGFYPFGQLHQEIDRIFDNNSIRVIS